MWYADTVVVSLEPGEDPALADGSRGSGTVSPEPAQHAYDTAGSHTTSARSVDAAGNESAESSLDVRVDTSAPEVSLDACPALVRFGTSVAVGWTASDTGSGLTGGATGSVALDSSAIGTRTVRIEVSDHVGHTASDSCSYEVGYDFTGFDAPLKAAWPALNTVTTGQVVPVRFGLGGDAGLDVLRGAPTVTPIACDTRQPVGAPRTAVAQRPLSYDASKRTYTFWWLTLKEWRKTCAELAITLDDGTTHKANVSFR